MEFTLSCWPGKLSIVMDIGYEAWCPLDGEQATLAFVCLAPGVVPRAMVLAANAASTPPSVEQNRASSG